MRKTGNLIIRQSAKKSSRAENPQSNTTTSFRTNQSKISTPSIKPKKSVPYQQMQVHKEMVRAQNLTEEEQKQISKEARKTVTKKIRSTEAKIESELVNTLEGECAKLGAELERQKMESSKLRFQIDKLRKNIAYLNEKLEKIYDEQSNLQKNNVTGKAEKEQLSDEVQELRNILQRKEHQLEYLKSQYCSQVEELQLKNHELSGTVEKLKIERKNLIEEKQQFQQEIEERQKQVNEMRALFQVKRKQWETHLKSLQKEKYEIVEKKGEKISRFQADTQKLSEKLKEEEGMRKKLSQKNKQLEKIIVNEKQTKKQLQDQISHLKKRVNDLSILKSSNNSILNQKIVKLEEQNEKLRVEMEKMKSGRVEEKHEKPVLFGTEDFD